MVSGLVNSRDSKLENPYIVQAATDAGLKDVLKSFRPGGPAKNTPEYLQRQELKLKKEHEKLENNKFIAEEAHKLLQDPRLEGRARFVKTDLEKKRDASLRGADDVKKRIEHYSGKISALKGMKP
jgi:hypothetical protein